VKTDEAAPEGFGRRRGPARERGTSRGVAQDSEGRIDKAAFTYDAQQDVYRCPTGQTLGIRSNSQDRQKSGVVIRRQYGNRGLRGVSARPSVLQGCDQGSDDQPGSI
jgi:hypothetical protein